MNIALLGNCQLEVIGLFLNSLKIENYNIIHFKPIYKINQQEDAIDLFHKLELCDFIFMQFHSEAWGNLSTYNISKYFEINVLPTLESRVSTPQLGYFTSTKLPDGLVYVDFRILHLYMQNTPIGLIEDLYHSITLNKRKMEFYINKDSEKYKELFIENKVITDISEKYKNNLLSDFNCYSTISHPNNKNLELLLQPIIKSTLGINQELNINGQDMLLNYVAPQIGSNLSHYYMMRPGSLKLASKIFYSFFDSIKKEILDEELKSSNYYSLIE